MLAHELIERFAGGGSAGTENEEVRHRIQSLLVSIDRYDNTLSRLEDTRSEPAAVDALNARSEWVRIELTFKDDKRAFIDHLSALTTGLRKRTVGRSETYSPTGPSCIATR